MPSSRSRRRGGEKISKTHKSHAGRRDSGNNDSGDDTSLFLQQLWVKEGLCSSVDEAHAVMEDFVAFAAVVDDANEAVSDDDDKNKDEATTTCRLKTQVDENSSETSQTTAVTRSSFQSAMVEYFSVTEEMAQDLWRQLVILSTGTSDEHDESSVDEESTSELPLNSLDDDEDDDDEIVGEGECALCERFILLSKHHLIPRSTWPRFEARLLAVAQALQDGDVASAESLAGPELQHLIPNLQPPTLKSSSNSSSKKNKATQQQQQISHCRTRVRRALQQTAHVCRPCHTAIHKSYDNKTLAWDYNTLDKLMDDEAIAKYAKWASQQKAGRFARSSGSRQHAGGNGGVPKFRSKHKSKKLT